MKLADLFKAKTQVEIAKALGLSQGAISKHFRGMGMSVTVASRYVEVFDVSWWSIVEYISHPSRAEPKEAA
jgi:hypothetical protein